jgi:hypothetical protein
MTFFPFSFAVIISLTVCRIAVIASVKIFHSRRLSWEHYETG